MGREALGENSAGGAPTALVRQRGCGGYDAISVGGADWLPFCCFYSHD